MTGSRSGACPDFGLQGSQEPPAARKGRQADEQDEEHEGAEHDGDQTEHDSARRVDDLRGGL